MVIKENFNLKQINTFKIDVNAKFYVKCMHDEDIIKFINFSINYNLRLLPLGNGSNVLFTKNFDGIILHILTSGITIIKETSNFIFVQVKSGENWNNFVRFCLRNNYGGIENLSLIPGTIGASVIQNIGAYGVEIKDVVFSLNAIKIAKTKKLFYITFTKNECNFNYRNSYFKQEGKNKWIVSDVIFKLTKRNHKIYSLYHVLQQKIKEKNIIYPTIQDMSNIIINIRINKFSKLMKFGNAGSFFKNPIIDIKHYNLLQEEYDDLIGFQVDNGIRISAGYLIKKIGFNGIKINNYGIYPNRSSILINYSNAKGSDILKFSEKIKKIVLEKFNILLFSEVDIIK